MQLMARLVLPSRMNSPFSLSYYHKPSSQLFGRLFPISIFSDSADIEPEPYACCTDFEGQGNSSIPLLFSGPLLIHYTETGVRNSRLRAVIWHNALRCRDFLKDL